MNAVNTFSVYCYIQVSTSQVSSFCPIVFSCFALRFSVPSLCNWWTFKILGLLCNTLCKPGQLAFETSKQNLHLDTVNSRFIFKSKRRIVNLFYAFNNLLKLILVLDKLSFEYVIENCSRCLFYKTVHIYWSLYFLHIKQVYNLIDFFFARAIIYFVGNIHVLVSLGPKSSLIQCFSYGFCISLLIYFLIKF